MNHRSVGLALLLVLSAAACGDGDELVTPGEQIQGTWQRTIGADQFVLVFAATGTFTANAVGDPNVVQGTYVFDADQITLTDDGCGTTPGVYTVSFAMDQLTFALGDDTCTRAEVVAGTWDRG